MPRRFQVFTIADRRFSPDDIKSKMLERDRLAATDDRTEAERWLGDPPRWRSALQSKNQSPQTATEKGTNFVPLEATEKPATAHADNISMKVLPVEALSRIADAGKLTIGQRKKIARALVDDGMSKRKIAEALRLPKC
jgi:hypothetical protein